MVAFSLFIYFCIVSGSSSDTTNYTPAADKLGIASAVICTVHCLVVPALFLIKYWWTQYMGKALMGNDLPVWWESVDYLFLVVSFIAVYHAAAHAAGKVIRITLWLFWGVLCIAIIFEHSLHWMAYIASAGLISTHFINISRHRKSWKAVPATRTGAETEALV